MDSGSDVPIWLIAAIAGGSATFGAIVGGVAAGLLEVWKQVIRGLAGARIVRYELAENYMLVDDLLNGSGTDPVSFREEAWLNLRTAVALFLSETDLALIGATYANGPVAATEAEALLSSSTPDARVESAREELQGWSRQLRASMHALQENESTGKLTLFRRLLNP